jgi:protein-serine/threonine kinase
LFIACTRSVIDPWLGNMNNNPPQQQQPQRLQLNFGFATDRNATAADGRQFPTTPSTFPQPVYPNQNGQQEIWGAQQSNAGFGTQSYFMSNAYPQYPPQAAGNMPHPAGMGAGAAHAQPQATPHQFRGPPQPAATFHDATNGLAQQLAHQNLGGNPTRSVSPYARQPSPNTNPQQPQQVHPAHQQPQQPQRPRTAGSTPQQGQYGNFLSPQVPAQNLLSLNDEEPPPKNPDKYADNVVRKAKVSTGLVNTFFKDNVQRARDRNGRYVSCSG